MFKSKFLRFFWVILLVISAFTLGYTLKPTTQSPSRVFSSNAGGGRVAAPPLNFRGRR